MIKGRGASLLLTALILLSGPGEYLRSQPSDGLRAELARQTALPDFPVRLSSAVDRASGISELISLLEEFVPKVQDGAFRRPLLLRWAAVLELEGRWEEAAARYEDAAFASPGQKDTDSLLWAARAWLAAGETDKALSILRILGVAASDSAVRARSLVLEGWARLIAGEPSEARSLAGRLVSAPADRETRLATLTLLWAASEGSSREDAALKIKKEFPGTPESAMIESGAVPPAAHWLLTAAGGGSRPAEAPTPGSTAAPSSVSPAASASVQPSGSSGITAFQAGAFSEESNAAAMIRELRAKGFAASAEKRERAGKPLWVVLVPVGSDAQATLLRLKDAGYEAYPVF